MDYADFHVGDIVVFLKSDDYSHKDYMNAVGYEGKIEKIEPGLDWGIAISRCDGVLCTITFTSFF